MSAVRIFVYGSLRRDATGTAHPLLRDARFLGAATVRGQLYRVDWYPGLVLSPDEGAVHGELFELTPDHLDRTIAALDDYEGGGFRRRRTVASLEGSEEALDTWTFAYLGPTHSLERIGSGDFGAPEHRVRR
jgi:gamma-glutamylcyclotransferase (GGCT)/AIG2-like uncharacterized protein YtfP